MHISTSPQCQTLYVKVAVHLLDLSAFSDMSAGKAALLRVPRMSLTATVVRLASIALVGQVLRSHVSLEPSALCRGLVCACRVLLGVVVCLCLQLSR